MQKKRKGFTLVELVIVIAVIAVLSAILVPTFSNVINNANLAKDKSNAKTMTTELMLDAVTDGLKSYTAQEVRALIMQKTSASNKTQSKGNSYWYNTEKNQIEVQDTKQMVNGAETTAGISVVYADSESSSQKTIFSLSVDDDYVYVFGDETLDNFVDVLSNLTTYARLKAGADTTAIKEEMKKLYDSAYDKLQKTYSRLASDAQEFAPDKCLYFDNVAAYGTATNGSYSNYVVVNGTTRISGAPTGENATVTCDTIVFPAGCKTNGNSFSGINASGTVTVTIPAENSATGYVVKQSVTDLVDYASSNSVLQDNVKTALKESYDLSSESYFDGVDFFDASSVITTVEQAVANQVSSAVLNSSFNVKTDEKNKVQYSQITFDYDYIQSELLAQNAKGRDLFFRTKNEVKTTGDAVYNLGFKPSNTVTTDAKLNTDKSGDDLLTAYEANDTATSPLSEYLVATIKINAKYVVDELNKLGYNVNKGTEGSKGTFELNKDDVIRFEYKNYRNYVVVSGACVFHTKDANGNEIAVNYKIAPVVYVKRVSTANVTTDVLAGLNGKIVISVPDVSSYVNGKNFKVKGVVDNNEVDLEMVTIGAHAGKYYYSGAGNPQEVRIYDGTTLVFRQFISENKTAQ